MKNVAARNVAVKNILRLGAGCALACVSAFATSASAEEGTPGKADAPAAGSTSTTAGTTPSSTPSLGVGDVRPAGKVLGLGVVVGSPIGLSGKYYLDGSSAVSFAIGFWGTEHGGAVVDYLFHPLGAVGDGSYGTPFLAVGGGAALGLGSSFGRGGSANGRTLHQFWAFGGSPYTMFPPANFAMDVHGTLGLGWSFRAPLDVFVEFQPGLLVVPQLNLGTRLTFGGRVYLG